MLLTLQFFNRRQLRAGHYKIPAQQQALTLAAKISTLQYEKDIFFISLSFVDRLLLSENKDSLQIINLKNQVTQLENSVSEIRRDELNYKLEKDLLKETYSNNYERISLIITIVLGIIGLFGYSGLKDINSIRKEYTTAL